MQNINSNHYKCLGFKPNVPAVNQHIPYEDFYCTHDPATNPILNTLSIFSFQGKSSPTLPLLGY